MSTLLKKETDFLGSVNTPSLKPILFLPSDSKELNPSYTHNSPNLIGFQAYLMAHLTMANASAHLSHYSTETIMCTQETC